jgi:hypothetical protein
MWRLWRFRPRPFWQPWHWSGRYYAWRLETYSGVPAHEVTWRTFFSFFWRQEHRRALRRYVRWLGMMERLRRF